MEDDDGLMWWAQQGQQEEFEHEHREQLCQAGSNRREQACRKEAEPVLPVVVKDK